MLFTFYHDNHSFDLGLLLNDSPLDG